VLNQGRRPQQNPGTPATRSYQTRVLPIDTRLSPWRKCGTGIGLRLGAQGACSLSVPHFPVANLLNKSRLVALELAVHMKTPTCLDTVAPRCHPTYARLCPVAALDWSSQEQTKPMFSKNAFQTKMLTCPSTFATSFHPICALPFPVKALQC
jgi:hypothetical protein